MEQRYGAPAFMRRALVCASAALTFCVCFAGGKDVQLVQGGRAIAEIVIAADADKAARFAATDLKWHLEKMTGVSFDIVTPETSHPSSLPICVGDSSLTQVKGSDLAPQRFCVSVQADRIELVGRDREDKGPLTFVIDEAGTPSGRDWPDFFDDQGTMYAVYDFLQRDLGVRWTDSTDYGTFVPLRTNLSVNQVWRIGEPFFLSRMKSGRASSYDPLLWPAKSDEAKAYDAIAYARNKGNGNLQKRLFLIRHRFGGIRRRANHSFYGWYDRFLNDGVHGEKKSPLFEAYHPEYFAKGYPGYPQLCYANPATIAQVVKDVLAYFGESCEKRNWGDDNYCLEPMDNNSYCKCPLCAPQYEPDREDDHGSDSTYWFRFVNMVAKEIAKTYPDKYISTLCYHNHEALPKVRLEPNVMVWFCLSDNRRPYTQNYERQMARMREWRAAYPDQPMAVWLYNTFPLETAQNGNFRCFPGAFAHEAERQYRLFKELNARHGIFHCGFNGEVDNYLQLKWMIDPSLSADALLDEYFGSYGAPGPFLKDFYLLCEKRFCDKSLYEPADWRQSAVIAWGKLGDEKTMVRLSELMSAAERAASTSTEKARVKLWKLGVWDYMKPAADAFRVRLATPVPEFSAVRIPAADGKWANVKTEGLESVASPLYGANSLAVSKGTPATVCVAHDGRHLYLELTIDCVTSNLLNSSGILSHDCWELVMARQQGQPYRHYFSSPDGRIGAASFGEVNWRANVPATESGYASFRATCETSLTLSRWTTRYVFPLSEICSGGVSPGEKLYFNGVAVLSRKLVPDLDVEGKYAILSLCPLTSVHTSDRTCIITLEP